MYLVEPEMPKFELLSYLLRALNRVLVEPFRNKINFGVKKEIARSSSWFPHNYFEPKMRLELQNLGSDPALFPCQT